MCKLGKAYLNASLSFILYSILKLLMYHTSSTTNHRWVINAQSGPVFLAHPVYLETQCIVGLNCAVEHRLMWKLAKSLQLLVEKCALEYMEKTSFSARTESVLKEPRASSMESSSHAIRSYQDKSSVYVDALLCYL